MAFICPSQQKFVSDKLKTEIRKNVELSHRHAMRVPLENYAQAEAVLKEIEDFVAMDMKYAEVWRWISQVSGEMQQHLMICIAKKKSFFPAIDRVPTPIERNMVKDGVFYYDEEACFRKRNPCEKELNDRMIME